MGGRRAAGARPRAGVRCRFRASRACRARTGSGGAGGPAVPTAPAEGGSAGGPSVTWPRRVWRSIQQAAIQQRISVNRRAGARASGRASERAAGGRVEGRAGGGSATARGRTLPVPGVAAGSGRASGPGPRPAHADGSGRAGERASEPERAGGGWEGGRAGGRWERGRARAHAAGSGNFRARAVRAPGAAGQVDRRFQPLRRKEAAQEGSVSPGRGAVGGQYSRRQFSVNR